jgi:hypothetical protein
MSQGRRRKTSFRLLIGGLAAVIAGPAVAQSCLQPAERTAFDLRALQSQLMVVALQCQRDNDYNAFVRRFQGDLAGAYRTMEGHFGRTGNRRSIDVFITQLANEQSQDGIRAGSHYCPLNTPLFQVALAQPNAAALSQMTVERNIINPITTPACPATPARATPAARPARR